MLTVKEAADALRVAAITVLRWCRSGALDASQAGAGGAWRVRVDVDGLPRFTSRARR